MKFHYGQKVKVISGFYNGITGQISDTVIDNGGSYFKPKLQRYYNIKTKDPLDNNYTLRLKVLEENLEAING